MGHLPALLRRAVAKGWHDRVLGLSAEAAFWQLLSLPSLFLGSVLVGVVVLPALVLGPTLLVRTFPSSVRSTAHTVVGRSYYPTVVLVLLLGLTTLYHLAPPRRLPWRRGVPGAVLAIVIF